MVYLNFQLSRPYCLDENTVSIGEKNINIRCKSTFPSLSFSSVYSAHLAFPPHGRPEEEGLLTFLKLNTASVTLTLTSTPAPLFTMLISPS